MPFTLAHPAAVVPIRRWLGVLSALVIGSMSPDLTYLFGGWISGNESHSLSGVISLCLPAGLIMYVVFHVFLKGPLLALLPTTIRCRLGAYTARFCSLPAASWAVVVVSLLVGALTHVVWDSFTHYDGAAVGGIPILQAHLLSIGTYRLHTYALLQHGSSVFGLALLVLWSWQALMGQTSGEDTLPIRLSSLWQVAAIVGMGVVPVVVGTRAGLHAFGMHSGLEALRVFIGSAIFAGMPALALTVVTYSLIWHALRLRRRSATQ